MKQQIAVLQREIRESDSTARLTATQQLHMTIAFIPDLSAGQEEDLIRRFTAIQLPSPLIACTSLSAMRTGNGRLYVLAVKPEAHLDQITTSVRDALDECDIIYDRRRVKYHITVARGRGMKAFHRQSGPLPYSDEVQNLVLFHSQLTHTGPVHTPVTSIRLKPLGTVI